MATQGRASLHLGARGIVNRAFYGLPSCKSIAIIS